MDTVNLFFIFTILFVMTVSIGMLFDSTMSSNICSEKGMVLVVNSGSVVRCSYADGNNIKYQDFQKVKKE